MNTGITREDAYVIVSSAMPRPCGMTSRMRLLAPPIDERLEADPRQSFLKETLDEIFNPWAFLQHKDEAFKKPEGPEF